MGVITRDDFVKRGVEPLQAVKDSLKRELTDTVLLCRKKIQSDWSNNEVDAGTFDNVETVAEEMEKAPYKRKSILKPDPKHDEEKINKAINAVKIDESKPKEEQEKEREQYKKRIMEKPVTLLPVSLDTNTLFRPVFRSGSQIIINVNIDHPYYQTFLVPLIGDLNKNDEQLSAEKIRNRDAIFMLFLSYSAATKYFEDTDDLFDRHLTEMGTHLKNAVKEYKNKDTR